jgi:acyl dehydratase
VLTDAELAGLVGHRFAGGTRRVAHWENWLLADCTRRGPMSDSLVHPVALFHVPIQAAHTSIGELLALGGSDGSPGSVTLLGYDWEYLGPMREDVELSGDGGIVAAERHRDGAGQALYDDLTFSIELGDPDAAVVARVTNRWRFRRTGSAPHQPANVASAGTPIPPLSVADVGADRMKTMAALLRDPYPIHWDVEAVRAAGFGDRPVNQGPLNLGYIANMLMAWAGDGSIRRLTAAFHGRVFAGDTVVASGEVIEIVEVGGARTAHCRVRLVRGDELIVSGTAAVSCS